MTEFLMECCEEELETCQKVAEVIKIEHDDDDLIFVKEIVCLDVLDNTGPTPGLKHARKKRPTPAAGQEVARASPTSSAEALSVRHTSVPVRPEPGPDSTTKTSSVPVTSEPGAGGQNESPHPDPINNQLRPAFVPNKSLRGVGIPRLLVVGGPKAPYSFQKVSNVPSLIAPPGTQCSAGTPFSALPAGRPPQQQLTAMQLVQANLATLTRARSTLQPNRLAVQLIHVTPRSAVQSIPATPRPAAQSSFIIEQPAAQSIPAIPRLVLVFNHTTPWLNAQSSPAIQRPAAQSSLIIEQPAVQSIPATPRPAVQSIPATPRPAVQSIPATPRPAVQSSLIIEQPAVQSIPATPRPAVQSSLIIEQPAVQSSLIIEQPAVQSIPTTPRPAAQSSLIIEQPAVQSSPATPRPAAQSSLIIEQPAAQSSPATPRPAAQSSLIIEQPAVQSSLIIEQPAVQSSPATPRPAAQSSLIIEQPAAQSSPAIPRLVLRFNHTTPWLNAQSSPAIQRRAAQSSLIIEQPAAQSSPTTPRPAAQSIPATPRPAAQSSLIIEQPAVQSIPATPRPAVQSIPATPRPAVQSSLIIEQPAVQSIPATPRPAAQSSLIVEQPAAQSSPNTPQPAAQSDPVTLQQTVHPNPVTVQQNNSTNSSGRQVTPGGLRKPTAQPSPANLQQAAHPSSAVRQSTAQPGGFTPKWVVQPVSASPQSKQTGGVCTNPTPTAPVTWETCSPGDSAVDPAKRDSEPDGININSKRQKLDIGPPVDCTLKWNFFKKTCPNCYAQFNLTDLLMSHMKRCCPDMIHKVFPKKVSQRTCTKRIVPVSEFYYGSHVGDQKAPKKPKTKATFKCNSCSKVLKNNIEFMDHIMHHLQSNESWDHRKTCQHCYRRYSSPLQLQRHLEGAHAQSTTSCKICEFGFKSEQIFLEHMKNTHKTGEMPYVCEVCDYRSSFFSEVENHFRSEHKDTKGLLCPFCLRVVESCQMYVTHFAKHQKRGTHACVKCRLNFLTNVESVAHKALFHHTFKKPKLLKGLPSGTKVIICASWPATSDSGVAIFTSSPDPGTTGTAGNLQHSEPLGPLDRSRKALWNTRITSAEVTTLIQEIIQATLPSLPEEKLKLVVEKLIQQGVESREDLKYVREEDIIEFIWPIQCRKLIDCWKSQDADKNSSAPNQPSTSTSPAPSTSRSSSPMSSPQPSPRPYVKKSWPDVFQVDWSKMPPGLLSTVTSGKRPSSADRRQFVKVLVDDIRKHDVNPTRPQCRLIARNVIKQYKQSFADTMDDGKTMIDRGYESLLSQINVRVEHLNRNNTLAPHRKLKKATGVEPKPGPADHYGCTRWQPALPPEETEDTLEAMRKRMTEIFAHEGLMGAETGEVQKLIETTYYLQRKSINATPAPPLEDLRSQWPFLFLPWSMCAHFELLTDIQILRRIEAFLEEQGEFISEYFEENPSNDDMKAVVSMESSITAPYILDLLMAHFEERRDALILEADVSATAATVTTFLALPDSPRLIVLGPAVDGSQWMVSAEGQVVCEGASFVLGLAVLFTCYYNFNLQYQEQAACTLKFIQRSCVGINPERGTKV